MRILAALSLLVAVAACSTSAPTPSPGALIHVVNHSDRAVMVTAGSILEDHPTTAARPCGGEVSLAVTEASYEPDGRLTALLAIDPTGSFDLALELEEGDPIDMPGTFSAAPIWSDGTLAGRLPVYLTVASDLSVTMSGSPSAPSSEECTPAY